MSAGDPARDAADLRRGLGVQALGYAAKLGLPLLLALATRRYGAERWGTFVAVQAVALLLARVCLLGLDKGLLWWSAQHEPARLFGPLRRALLVVAVCASAVSLAVIGCASWFPLSWFPRGQIDSLRVVMLGLLPFVCTELLLHVSMGRRALGLQVAVRDTLNPILQVTIAIVAFELGLEETGLAWGFVLSHAAGCAVAYVGLRRALGRPPPGHVRGVLPPRLLRYAWPLWLADLGNSLLLRLDVIVLAACVDARSLGVWAIVMQFVNSLRQIRRAFDPLVTAITADIASRRDTARLTEAYSRAAELISATQLPVFALLFAAAPVVLPLYGPAFSAGVTPLLVLGAFMLVNGAAGLAGLVLNGYGRSGFALANTALAIALQYALLRWLAPAYGLVGAAFAVGSALTLTNVVQLLQMRLITGSFHYRRRAALPLAVAALAALPALLAGSLVAGQPWIARALACALFLLAYGGGLLASRRRERSADVVQTTFPTVQRSAS